MDEKDLKEVKDRKMVKIEYAPKRISKFSETLQNLSLTLILLLVIFLVQGA